MSPFPELPILSPDPPRKSQAEKYGLLYWLAIAGLVALVTMMLVFAYGLWAMRSVWADAYAVADRSRSEADRVNAAWRIARDERVNDLQRRDLALNPQAPDLARYVLAESLTSDAVADPRAYALAVSRTEGWPRWLRLLLIQPLAARAAEGGSIDAESVREMATGADESLALWADAILAMGGEEAEREEAAARLKVVAASGKPTKALAADLAEAVRLAQPKRAEAIARANRWPRANDPGAEALWRGWSETPGGLARELPR